jgi:periplasmic protein TonB
MVTGRMFAKDMFAESLLQTTSTQRTRRGWTTLTSFGAQALALGLLLLLPLWKTVGLPKARTISTPVSLGRPDVAPAETTAAARTGPARAEFVLSSHPIIVAPGRRMTTTATEEGPSSPPCEACTGSIGIGAMNGTLIPGISGSGPVILPAHPAPPARQYRTSQIMEGSLLQRVQPTYPYPAKMARVQGTVLLAAVISKAGMIENLQVMSGNPLLVGAAIDAVRQWRYRPYILNGEPIEVETQIQVKFILGEN